VLEEWKNKRLLEFDVEESEYVGCRVSCKWRLKLTSALCKFAPENDESETGKSLLPLERVNDS